MKIQLICNSGSHSNAIVKELNYTVNTYSNPYSFDNFDLNILDMTSLEFWQSFNLDKFKITQDYEDISKICKNSKKSKILIILPQNLKYEDFRNTTVIHRLKENTNCIEAVLSHIAYLNPQIIFERTTTKIEDVEYYADFILPNWTEYLTKSEVSEKVTTMPLGRVIVSVLNIFESKEKVDTFVNFILGKDTFEFPEWLKSYQILDDEDQIKKREEQEFIISNANKEIENIDRKLSENERIKSILFLNGDKLVEIVFEMLEKILDCNLNEFKDEHKEDFKICKSGIIFIGEIKGVNNNVRSEYISQLDQHYNNYVEDMSDEEKESVKGLLIITHERTKPIIERNQIGNNQIKLAERNKSLIIPTTELIKMYEEVVNGRKSSAQCVDYLKANCGIFEIKNFK